MRGRHDPQATMLAFVDLEERVPQDHPIRTIKIIADDVMLPYPAPTTLLQHQLTIIFLVLTTPFRDIAKCMFGGDDWPLWSSPQQTGDLSRRSAHV